MTSRLLEIVETFPTLQAHRGYHVWATENTLEALQQAKQKGYKACEFDVRLSQDGVVVLHHDVSLARIYKEDRIVHQLPWQDLKGLRVNRLVDVLESNDVPEFLNIEIKSESFFDFRLEENLLILLQSLPHDKKILLSSFNPLSLMYFQHRLPHVPRALIVNKRKWPGNPRYLRQMWFDALLGTQFLHIDHTSFERQLLFSNFLRERKVAVWTVNDVTSARNFLDHGVASVISDEVTPQSLTQGKGH